MFPVVFCFRTISVVSVEALYCFAAGKKKSAKIEVDVPAIKFPILFHVPSDLLCWLGGIIGGLSTFIQSLGQRP